MAKHKAFRNLDHRMMHLLKNNVNLLNAYNFECLQIKFGDWEALLPISQKYMKLYYNGRVDKIPQRSGMMQKIEFLIKPKCLGIEQ